MPEIDKEQVLSVVKELLSKDEDLLVKVIKRLLLDKEILDLIKKAILAAINDLYDEMSRWAFKCIAIAALAGLIYIGLIGAGWKK